MKHREHSFLIKSKDNGAFLISSTKLKEIV